MGKGHESGRNQARINTLLSGIVYKDSTPSRVAVVTGEMPLMIDRLIPSLPLIQSGRLRTLGVTSL